MSAPSDALQRVITAVRSAPLAGHSDLVLLANAFAARIADAEQQFAHEMDLGLVSEAADAVAERLDDVYVRETDDMRDFLREMEQDDRRRAA